MNKIIKFVDLPVQLKEQRGLFIKCLEEVLAEGDFILGHAVKEFEQKMAEYNKVQYALGLNSGTDAIFLSLKALNIGRGDEVITSPNSFIATAASIVATGATPIFVDVKPDYNIDENQIRKKINKNTKAIIPIHLTGRISEMDHILNLAKEYNLKVIEDACQAIGAEYKHKKAGSLGITGCFSINPVKNLNVIGDGGAIITNNEEIYEKIKLLRNHGLENRNKAPFFGYNSRLDTLQAKIASIRLNSLENIIKQRRRNARIYYEELKEIVKLPNKERQNGRDTYHLFMIRAKKRDKLKEFLAGNGIQTAIHYPIPIHLQEAAKIFGYKKGDFPETEKQANEILSLPIHQNLEKSQILYIINNIKNFYNKNGN